MTEKQFEAIVIGLAKGKGWEVVKTHVFDKNGKGFPDLLIFGNPSLGEKYNKKYAWELKVKNKKPSQEQLIWLNRLRQHGFEASVVTPKDMEYIKECLYITDFEDRMEHIYDELEREFKKTVIPNKATKNHANSWDNISKHNVRNPE